MTTIQETTRAFSELQAISDVLLGQVFRFPETGATYMRVNNPHPGMLQCYYVELATGYLSCTDPTTDVVQYDANISITRALD